MTTQGQVTQPIQLKVTLVDSEPEVWRQVLVPANIQLSDLHSVIQQVMGWQNLHDYSFQTGLGTEKSLLDTEQTLADTLSTAGEQTVYYNYDKENGWRHRLTPELTNTEISDKYKNRPACIAGAAACPPEGSGGIWGYDQLLARLEDIEDPEYIDLIDKYGDFDPDAFDLAAANSRLEK